MTLFYLVRIKRRIKLRPINTCSCYELVCVCVTYFTGMLPNGFITMLQKQEMERKENEKETKLGFVS